MSAKVDGVLEQVGPLGRYQIVQQFTAGIGNAVSAFHLLAIVFFSITPEMRCRLPGWSNDTYHIQSLRHNDSINRWIPLTGKGVSESCRLFQADEELNMTAGQYKCNSFVYSHSEYRGVTLKEQFGLVCSSAWIDTAVKVSFTIGLAVGSFTFGVIGDWVGRRYSMIAAMLIGGCCSMIASFSVNIYMFAVFRFVSAMCFVGILVLSHCISTEIAGPSKRPFLIALKFIFWPAGTCILSLIAYLCPNWNWFELAISVPVILAGITMICFLNETPHYLVAKGKHEEAVKLFTEIARKNGRKLPDNLLNTLKEEEEAATTEKTREIFHSPVLLKRSLVFFYLWFISGLGYYGLAFNVGNLSGDIYINNLIYGLCDFPLALVVFASKAIGRKKPTVICFFIGGLALIGCALMYVYLNIKAHPTPLISVATIGKFCLNIVFGFAYIWSCEIFPTTLRSSLMGLCSVFSRIGTILSPIIVDMYIYFDTPFAAGISPVIFGITLLIGGLLSLYLPETNNMKIPETIADANQFLTKDTSRKSALVENDKYYL